MITFVGSKMYRDLVTILGGTNNIQRRLTLTAQFTKKRVVRGLAGLHCFQPQERRPVLLSVL